MSLPWVNSPNIRQHPIIHYKRKERERNGNHAGFNRLITQKSFFFRKKIIAVFYGAGRLYNLGFVIILEINPDLAFHGRGKRVAERDSESSTW